MIAAKDEQRQNCLRLARVTLDAERGLEITYDSRAIRLLVEHGCRLLATCLATNGGANPPAYQASLHSTLRLHFDELESVLLRAKNNEGCRELHEMTRRLDFTELAARAIGWSDARAQALDNLERSNHLERFEQRKTDPKEFCTLSRDQHFGIVLLLVISSSQDHLDPDALEEMRQILGTTVDSLQLMVDQLRVQISDGPRRRYVDNIRIRLALLRRLQRSVFRVSAPAAGYSEYEWLSTNSADLLDELLLKAEKVAVLLK